MSYPVWNKAGGGGRRENVAQNFFLFFLIQCTCMLSVYTPGCQKRALDPRIDGCEPLFDCWLLNTVPLEEQQTVLLIAELSFQPL